MGQVLFITGTDTAVGKTLLTALLLVHLRPNRHALAIKPFCSGSLSDVRVLSAAQNHELPFASINPFYYEQPVAPLPAARRSGLKVTLPHVLKRIRPLAEKCELLLVEGAGGLCVPLGEGYAVVDVIQALRCPVLLVARNKLGTVNHTLLSLEALQRRQIKQVQIVLMDPPKRDQSCKDNAALIAELASPVAVVQIPFLGARAKTLAALLKNEKRLKKALAQLVASASVSLAFGTVNSAVRVK
jgi:dethiobiotin synthetase